MADHVSESPGWVGGHAMAPITLVSPQDKAATTWRLPRDLRLLPRPSFSVPRSATVTCRSVNGASRRRRPAVAAAWGTLDPMGQITTSVEGGKVAPEPPLVTVHVNNDSCAASGSEAFFNLTQHGGRRGTAISRSSSCVSALSHGSYKVYSLNPPILTAAHGVVGRGASITHGGRRLGRSYSVAPGDGCVSGAGNGSRVAGRRPQKLRQHFSFCGDHHVYHQHQHLTFQHHPAKYRKTYGILEYTEKGFSGANGCVLPRMSTTAPVLAQPRPPLPAVAPDKWHQTSPDGTDCRCQPCSLGVLVTAAYKAVLKAASNCMFRRYKGEFDLMSANGHPTPSPTPPNGSHTDMMPQRKVVVALYDYNATDPGDLSLRKHDELEVIEDTQEHWWKMRNIQTGLEGFAPSNYVRERGTMGLQQYEWYLGDATRQRAEILLMQQEREGGFVVRNSTTNSGIYTLSVFSKQSHPQVKHYHIKKDQEGNYYLSHNIKCQTIPDLIHRHQHNPGGLCARLRPPVQGKQAPTTAGLSHDKWEIDPNELNLLEELGSGQFGVVRHGKLRCLDVAVKMMKEGTMSEDEFIEEAKVMTQLRHTNLVQLYGVCSRHRPIYIVTEYLRHGSLLHYLRANERSLINNTDVLLDMCLQVCAGMAYLEKQKFIHRDLAARNCLVGAQNEIKVGDFGLARYVVDDEYTGSGGAKFPIKWAAPEVLNFMRFSSKSDVWAFGVLMWEVFTCGKMPYGRMKNAEVVEMVQNGRVLEQPRFCPDYVFSVMRQCWIPTAEMRPSFSDIARSFPDE